jgi:hypothetical protein
MPKAKITRLEVPKAKLLKYNPNGKSIPIPYPQRDEIAERFSFLRHDCSDAQWAEMRPIIAASLEGDLDKMEALLYPERSGGTAS